MVRKITPSTLGFISLHVTVLYLIMAFVPLQSFIGGLIGVFVGYSYLCLLWLPFSLYGIYQSLRYLQLDTKNKSIKRALWFNTSFPLLMLLHILSNIL